VEFCGRKVSVAEISSVQLQPVVGENDNPIHGGEELWELVQKMKRKGKNIKDEASETRGVDRDLAVVMHGRFDEAREICDHWRQVGIEAFFDIVPDAAHESAKVISKALEFLRAAMQLPRREYEKLADIRWVV
jgi:hypothetical protein